MKVTLTFVPPGGGEADYHLDFELPALPAPGDYISFTRPDEEGSHDFIVRRSWWTLHHPTNGLSTMASGPRVSGSLTIAMVECEFALAPFSSASHKSSCEMYKGCGKPLKIFDESCY